MDFGAAKASPPPSTDFTPASLSSSASASPAVASFAVSSGEGFT
jgi:hypothetical protein